MHLRIQAAPPVTCVSHLGHQRPNCTHSSCNTGVNNRSYRSCRQPSSHRSGDAHPVRLASVRWQMASNKSPTAPVHQDGKPHRDDEHNSVKPRAALRFPKHDAGPAQSEPSAYDHTSPSSVASPLAWRNLVFPDPVAFRFLEDDPCVRAVDQRCVLYGYELYLVEQWACSRQSPTLVVATYTGDEAHSITVDVLAVPEDEALWSPRLRIYLKAALQHHARAKTTDLGELLVTNLSSFPSALTVIPVPDGDVRKHRQLFVVNENLKRLGCSGRSGLTLTDPAEATQAKFHQLYKTSDRIPFLQSVTELIKLCQIALYMLEKLDAEYIDGLLCDVTETAIANWWTEVGVEHYNFEPTDGILGPSTVAALLGMLMGARNRLHWYGAPVSKDVFDIEHTKRGIAYFQKQQKLDKTRRLDRQTLFRLHTATAKAASGEGWGVQKAVKSTVSEIGGKRGEIVMDMVSGRDKGGLADIETPDIDTFAILAYGERPKWLWHGKPRRGAAEIPEYEQELGVALARHDTLGLAAKRTQSLPFEDEADIRRREDGNASTSHSPYASTAPTADGERDPMRRNVFKSVAGKMSDARSGLGRIKDAVGGGRRGHASRPSASNKEEFLEGGGPGAVATGAVHAAAMASTPAVVAHSSRNMALDEYLVGTADPPPQASTDLGDTHAVDSKRTKRPTDERSSDPDGTFDGHYAEASEETRARATPRDQQPSSDKSHAQGPLREAEQRLGEGPRLLCRRRSCGVSDLDHKPCVNEQRWARRMSFGDAEPAILTWTEVVDSRLLSRDGNQQGALSGDMEHLARLLDDMAVDGKPWVEQKLKLVQALDERYGTDSTELQKLYQQLNEACQRVKQDSDELLAAERGNLTESLKEVDVLVARLEYEIDELVQKVQDAEDGIHNFERQVDGVERRAQELNEQLETESWLHWFVRTLTGVGTGPNITRERPR